MKVLVIDDSPEVTEAVALCFELRWPHSTIISALSGNKGVDLVEAESPDMVILDIGLPDIDGFEACRQIRSFSETPIIMLTVRDRDVDIARGLELGADDYITKPFSPSELLARIETVLRRRIALDVLETRPPFLLGDLAINFAERRVTVASKPVRLSPKEYKILHELAVNAGRVLTHDQILQKVWGLEYSGETELVRSMVRNLRRKLGDDGRHPHYIHTEPEVGYRVPRA